MKAESQIRKLRAIGLPVPPELLAQQHHEKREYRIRKYGPPKKMGRSIKSRTPQARRDRKRKRAHYYRKKREKQEQELAFWVSVVKPDNNKTGRPVSRTDKRSITLRFLGRYNYYKKRYKEMKGGER